MNESCWDQRLPSPIRHAVRIPRRFERHEDISAHARKCLGFDDRGERCFYRHEFVVTELRFDADEWPQECPIYWERVDAWRLADGRWLCLDWHGKDEDCSGRHTQAHVRIDATMPA